MLFHPNVGYSDRPGFFQKIFNNETLSYFSSVTELQTPIHSRIYNNAWYFDEWRNPTSRPGEHHWDLFVDDEYFASTLLTNNSSPELRNTGLSYFRYYSDKIFTNNNTLIKGIYPKFTNYIEDKINKFLQILPKDYNFLHMRMRRSNTELNGDTAFMERLYNFIDNQELPLYLGTNSDFIFNALKTHKNIFVYKTDSSISNSDATLNHMHINYCDLVAEMACVKNAKKVLSYAEFAWVSNFLFYASLYNRDLKLEPITRKLLDSNTVIK